MMSLAKRVSLWLLWVGACTPASQQAHSTTVPEDERPLESPGARFDPLADTDLDRILDSADQCPGQAEVYNGYEDEDGCPDTSYCPLMEVQRLEIRSTIQFAENSASVGPNMTAQLDEIAQLFLSNPDLAVVVIQGHASSGERHAARLARARADAISAAMLARGVQPDWLQTTSTVEEEPGQEFVDFAVTETPRPGLNTAE